MSRVSVIIPCYNNEKEIVKCLDALENQQEKDFDVIIINDCSTDNSKTVIDDYIKSSDIDIVLMNNPENLGPAKSREKAIEYSNSMYIAFCDSDDWYDPFFLSETLNALKEDKTDIVFCGLRLVDGNGRIISENKPDKRRIINSINEALLLNIDSLCVTVVSRKIMSKIKGPNLRNGEDMALIPILIAQSKGCSVLDKTLYNYYCRDGSASMHYSPDVVSSLLDSFSYIEKTIGNEYKSEVEYIGVRNIIYGSLICLFKYSYDVKWASKIIDNFNERYPKWIKNIEVHKRLPFYKRCFVYLANYKLFIPLKIMAMIHRIMTEGIK